MKEKWEKFKKFYNSRFGKPLIFFGLYFIFFAIIFSLGGNSNSVGVKDSESEDMWKSINKNYEYLYQINEHDQAPIILQGKKYNNKNLFTKTIQDVPNGEFYIFYDDIKIKEEKEWVSKEDFIFVSDIFDDRLLDLEYLKMLVADSEFTNSKANFDETKSDFYKFGMSDIEVISANNSLKQIIITNPQYNVNFQYKNINEVQDFVVE